jgi:hypothetical protein
MLPFLLSHGMNVPTKIEYFIPFVPASAEAMYEKKMCE